MYKSISEDKDENECQSYTINGSCRKGFHIFLFVLFLFIILITILNYYFNFFNEHIFGQVYFLIPIATYIVAIVGLDLKTVYGIYKVRKTAKKREKAIKSRFVSIFSGQIKGIHKILKLRFPPNYGEDTIVKDMLKELLNSTSEDQVNSYVLIYFCESFLSKKDDDRVQKFIMRYSKLLQIGQQADSSKLFQSIYCKVLNKHMNSIEVFEREFIDTFLRPEFMEPVIRLLEKESNLKVLRELILDGHLSMYGISEEIYARIERELRSERTRNPMFLIIGQKIPKSVKNYVASMRHVGTVFSQGYHNYNSLYLVRLPKSVSSTKFIKYVDKHQNEFRDSMLWLLPINSDSIHDATFSQGSQLRSGNVKKSYSEMQAFVGSNRVSEVDVIRKILIRSSIKLDELLAILPLNLMCPDANQSERNFINANQLSIKEELEVTSLADYALLNKEVIARVFSDLGRPEYIQSEIATLKFDNPPTEVQIETRFKTLAESIIQGSRKFKSALGKVF